MNTKNKAIIALMLGMTISCSNQKEENTQNLQEKILKVEKIEEVKKEPEEVLPQTNFGNGRFLRSKYVNEEPSGKWEGSYNGDIDFFVEFKNDGVVEYQEFLASGNRTGVFPTKEYKKHREMFKEPKRKQQDFSSPCNNPYLKHLDQMIKEWGYTGYPYFEVKEQFRDIDGDGVEDYLVTPERCEGCDWKIFINRGDCYHYVGSVGEIRKIGKKSAKTLPQITSGYIRDDGKMIRTKHVFDGRLYKKK